MDALEIRWYVHQLPEDRFRRLRRVYRSPEFSAVRSHADIPEDVTTLRKELEKAGVPRRYSRSDEDLKTLCWALASRAMRG